MTNFLPIDANMIRVGDLSTNIFTDISESIISLEVSLTMDMSSQITFEVIDNDFTFAKNNYFQIRRDVFYQNLIFEISRIDVQKSSSLEPLYRIVARSKNIQLMKRDKNPESFRGVTATQFAFNISERFKMGFFGQPTVKSQTIVKARNAKNDESTWVVLERLASDNQYVVFETDNILFFTSEQNLLGKWGDPQYTANGQKVVPFGWPEQNETRFPGSGIKYILLDMPSFGRSDDDPNDADGNMLVDRKNGRLLRPGMTVNMSGIPDFEGNYLITSVEFSEGVPDPVRVTFRSPFKPEQNQQQQSTGSGGGGPTPSSTGLPQDIFSALSEFIKKNTTNDPSQKSLVHVASYESALRLASRLALRIWNATTIQEKNEIFASLQSDPSLAAFGGVRGAVFRSLVSVQDRLNRNLTQRAPILPKNIENEIRNFFLTERFRSLQERSQATQRAIADAASVYTTTNVGDAQSLIIRFRSRYGQDSPNYRVFLDGRIRSLLFAEMPPVLGINFPEVT